MDANLENIRLANWADLEMMLTWRGSTIDMYNAITEEFLNLQRGTCQIFLAFNKKNKLIGTVQLKHEHFDPELCDEKSAYVQALEVRDDYFRRGVASNIMNFLEQHANQNRIERLTLMVEKDNAPAIALYQKLGFHRFKTASWVWQGKEFPTICLEKHLKIDMNSA